MAAFRVKRGIHRLWHFGLNLAKAGGPLVEDIERWKKELCALASIEQDPDKLLVLVQEINRLLEEKEARLRGAYLEKSEKPNKASDVQKLSTVKK
jgi:hypothetical protein